MPNLSEFDLFTFDGLEDDWDLEALGINLPYFFCFDVDFATPMSTDPYILFYNLLLLIDVYGFPVVFLLFLTSKLFNIGIFPNSISLLLVLV